MMLFMICVLCISMTYVNSISRMNSFNSNRIVTSKMYTKNSLKFKSTEKHAIIASVLPGDPVIVGTFALGIMNALSIYSNIIIAR